MDATKSKDTVSYRHTQYSLISMVVFSVLLIFLLMLMLETGFTGWALIAFVIFLLCLVTFASLTTEVRPDQLTLLFGPGLLRTSILLDAVDNLRPIEIDPRAGSAIYALYNVWFYNLAGLKAVEMDMLDGRVIRVGTDDPVELARAIENALIDRRSAQATTLSQPPST